MLVSASEEDGKTKCVWGGGVVGVRVEIEGIHCMLLVIRYVHVSVRKLCYHLSAR